MRSSAEPKILPAFSVFLERERERWTLEFATCPTRRSADHRFGSDHEPPVATWSSLVLLVVALVLLLVFLLPLMPAIRLAPGLIAFAAVVAVLVIGAVALIVAAPYCFGTKPAEMRPESSTTLDQLRER